MIHKIFVPALLALSLCSVALAAPAKAPVVAQSNMDARGVAALDKSIAFYKKHKSFSFVATEIMYLDGEEPSRARFEVSLQMPYRASLRAMALDAQGKELRQVDVLLLDARSYRFAHMDEAAQINPVGSSRAEREKALVEMFRGAPAIGLSLVSLALGENPARQSRIQSVRYGEMQDGKRTLKTVTLIGNGPMPLSIELGLSPRNFAVERVVIRGNSGQKLTTITRFSNFAPNWKGSQSATDAAIYNWSKLAPCIAVAPPKPKAVVQVDPKARALFARAVELYSELDGLRVAWTQTEDGEKTNASFDFDRAGRVRIENADPFEALKIIDGKNEWTLDESRTNDAEEVRYTREVLEEDSAASYSLIALELSFGVAGEFAFWLDETNPLDTYMVPLLAEALELREFRASLLSPQPFGGQPCDLVRITTKGDTTEQKTYWFARADGRLMRYQERESRGNAEFRSQDFQITEQTFNPAFAPDTFKFTPPAGAKLEKE